MTDRSESPSILSRGERDVATRLREGRSVAEIAEARDTTTEGIEKAIDRVREKTERALTTLAESPFTAELGADLDPESRRALRDALAERADLDNAEKSDDTDS
ncbi:hypothetical protein BRC68_09430 [Halobacteriales archaeon QH_6_64_20]|jgi:hypothetical protein|nr:MAG: hypothetical protein BRC68_09430 [Halobacteriales archaeon QH_6_64_20]